MNGLIARNSCILHYNVSCIRWIGYQYSVFWSFTCNNEDLSLRSPEAACASLAWF